MEYFIVFSEVFMIIRFEGKLNKFKVTKKFVDGMQSMAGDNLILWIEHPFGVTGLIPDLMERPLLFYFLRVLYPIKGAKYAIGKDKYDEDWNKI